MLIQCRMTTIPSQETVLALDKWETAIKSNGSIENMATPHKQAGTRTEPATPGGHQATALSTEHKTTPNAKLICLH